MNYRIHQPPGRNLNFNGIGRVFWSLILVSDAVLFVWLIKQYFYW